MKSADAFTSRNQTARLQRTASPLPRKRISTKEARKLLGKPYAHLSDDQVDRIVNILDFIATDFVDKTVPK